jgi:ABC-type lipoprotein export system ATPase subunit
LTVPAGEFVSITGPSGSGKSTLMNILGLLDRATEGTHRFVDQEVSALTPDAAAEIRRRHIGFIFQSYQLVAHRTVAANVEMPLLYHGLPRPKRREAAVASLERVGMGHRLEHEARLLSGGEQQRVAIARALVTKPQLLLADEPTGAVDSENGRKILDLLLELNSEGRTLILVTHDASIAALAKRSIRLQDGRIVN